MPDIRVKSQTAFNIYINEIDRVYDNMVMDIESSVARMNLLGMSSEQISSRLMKDLENGTGPFQTLRRVEKPFTDLINFTSQLESNELVKESADLFTWRLDPTAKEHCESCIEYSKKGALSWDEWEDLGIPGAGNTECGSYCKCTLMPYRAKDAEK